MENNIKLKLETIKVQSFVTSVIDIHKLIGGNNLLNHIDDKYRRPSNGDTCAPSLCC